MRRAAPRWLAVAGTRPNLVKLAPLVRAARAAGRRLDWVHTGQHWDPFLSEEIRRGVGLPAPAVSLGVGAGSLAEQTGRIVSALAPVIARIRPSVVVVVGDVTSTAAAAVAAAQAGVPVAHVEAGLRSGDLSMPEERHRILVDRLSDALYVTEPAGLAHLRREGVAGTRVRFVGSPLADALAWAAGRLAARPRRPVGEVVVTLHRAANVDDRRRLGAWCRAFVRLARAMPVVFPAHPRTRGRLAETGWDGRLARAGVRLDPPWGWLPFLRRLAAARAVLTDSGGVPEEASLLGVPCLALRDRTEKPWTLSHGTVRLAGSDPAKLPEALEALLDDPPRLRREGRVWDGKACPRIVADLSRRFV